MGWLGLVRAVLGFLDTIGRALEQRRLIQSGEAQAAARALGEAINVIDKANRARRDADRRNADPSRLRDDDGHRRD
jgi:hypothetical protein